MKLRTVLVIVAMSSAAHAGPEVEDTNAARDAFVEATRLAKQSEWRKALAAFERSSALREHPVTTYNIAFCERALGSPLRAWVLFGRALEPHAGETLPPDLTDAARTYRSESEAKLARIQLAVPAAATLTVDGQPLSEVAAGVLVAGEFPGMARAASLPTRFELMVEPGAHAFVLSGVRTARVRRELAAGDNGTLVLSLEPTPTPTPTATRRSAPPARAAEPAADTDTDTAPIDYTLPIVSYAVAAVGVGVGAVFGFRALADERELHATCENRSCPTGYQDELDSARTNATISTIGFGVGAAGAVLGTYLLMTTDRDVHRRAVSPILGPGWAGMRSRF